MDSPAEAYQKSRANPLLQHFANGLDFPLDDFQERACSSVEAGRSVLVAAPTGAGKTLVGEFAVAMALAQGRKAFYTTPLKALSNQKYQDFLRKHGAQRVGLLTGDTSINSEAEVVVMTTEVLRNMIYAKSSTLEGLGYVVLDEVHFLADRFRGPVWEEVILQLSAKVQLISLSATVSNVEEFGDWLGEVRGSTDVVVSETRPVPLWPHLLVGRELFDLYPDGEESGERVNPQLQAAVGRLERTKGGRGGGMRGGGRRDGRGAGRGPSGRYGQLIRPPSRPSVIETLDQEGLLPAIVFIFSRAGCDGAVAQVRSSGLSLTTPLEQETIAQFVDQRTAELAPADLDAVGYWAWRDALIHGVGAHHAGLLPVFKEVVEHLFLQGLLRVVYATETLALGINMPARTVVLERLSKWDGTRINDVTAGEYTQLTGRAGRRGIDVEGHAVTVYSSEIDPVRVASLVSRRTYPLRSAFRPTYNMTVNLLRRLGLEPTVELLESSFAQFQTDRSTVGMARQLHDQRQRLKQAQAPLQCERGDVASYLQLREQLSADERDEARVRSQQRAMATSKVLENLRVGAVIRIPSGRRQGLSVVTGVSRYQGRVQLTLVGSGGKLLRATDRDLPAGTEQVAAAKVSKGFRDTDPRQRRELSAQLNHLHVRPPTKLGGPPRRCKNCGRSCAHILFISARSGGNMCV